MQKEQQNSSRAFADALPAALAVPTTEEEGPQGFYPLRFLGMALLIAWLCCTHVPEIYPGSDALIGMRGIFDLGMRVGDIGTFIVFALFATRIGPLSHHMKLGTAFVAITCAGTAAIVLALLPQGVPVAVTFAASIATAIGGAFLFCLWAQIYCQMSTAQTIIYGSCSCIGAALVSFLVGVTQQPYAIVFTALLPLGSLICARLSLRILPDEPSAEPGVRYPLPWKLIAMVIPAALMSSIASGLIAGGVGGAVHRVVATGLAGIAILAMVYFRRERCDVRFLAKIALPLALLAFVILPFAGTEWAFLVSFLGKLAYVWFTFFVLLMMTNILRRYDVPSLRPFAVTRASSEGAILLGVLLRTPLRSLELYENVYFLYATMAVGIIVVLVCVIIWMSEKSVNADWGASGINIETGTHAVSPHERYVARCEEVGTRFGLTERETQIMGLIGQGKSRADIEQELFLSENTVKTHVSHVYQKLGVHSKSEVRNLLEF